jgi:uncharacterized protein YigA (DUF484 family)
MQTETENTVTTEQVVRFLTENPTFFLKQESLLADLYLPHPSGEAVSLLERQVAVLRDRNMEMRKRYNDMIEQGERNDILFQKTRTLVLNLLESKSLNDLSGRLKEYCEREFQVDLVQFTVFGSPDAFRTSQCRVLPQPEAERVMPALFTSPVCISGIFRPEELKFLFAGQQGEIASGIALPIRNSERTLGMLALGSLDAHYFRAGMDTLFLTFIGDVIARILPRFSP